jgi:hypothetical protein
VSQPQNAEETAVSFLPRVLGLRDVVLLERLGLEPF